MKNYRLLKDSPEADAGTVFTNCGGGLFSYPTRKKETCHVFARYVENNPEWFEEIKEDDDMDDCYGIKALSWRLVNKIHNEGMPDDLWKRRQFFIDYFKEQMSNEPKALFFEYDGSKPDEVRFDNKTYVLKEKSGWSYHDMIEAYKAGIQNTEERLKGSLTYEDRAAAWLHSCWKKYNNEKQES